MGSLPAGWQEIRFMRIALSGQEWRRMRVGLLFASPWIIGFIGFTLYPIIASFYYSLHVYTTFGQPMIWVGLENYAELLGRDELFWVSLYNTAYMVFIGVPFHILVAILLALMLNLPLRGVAVYRTIF